MASRDGGAGPAVPVAAGGSPAAPAATAATDTRELTVPLRTPGVLHLCVEYPGYVGDEQRVLETLGGLEGLARQLQENPKALPLRLRPGDRNCHPTFGRRDATHRLLLKLTRQKPAAQSTAAGAAEAAGSAAASASATAAEGAARGDNAAGGTAWTAEVVAELPYSFRWTTPADYQYVAHDSRPIEDQGLELQQGFNPPGFQPQPLLCAPPLFAKQPQFDYAFRGYVSSAAPGTSLGEGVAAAAAGGTGAGGAGAGKKKGGAGVMASFFDLEVPQPLPEAALAAAQAHHAATLRLLRSLLAKRPVWPAAALLEAAQAAGSGTAASGRYAVDDLLPKLCYKFRNGPWKNAWTRRGFDPRSDPSARRLQCLEYHLPSEWYAKIAERRKAAALAAEHGRQPAQQAQAQQQGQGLPPLASSYRQLLRFEAVPSTQSCSLQLGALGDSVVQQLLEDPANHAQHCSDSSGWLASAAADAIKRRVKERFQAVLDGAPIADDGGSFRAAAEAMQLGDDVNGTAGDDGTAGSEGVQAMQVDDAAEDPQGGSASAKRPAGVGAAAAGAAAAGTAGGADASMRDAVLADHAQQHLTIHGPPAAQPQQQGQESAAAAAAAGQRGVGAAGAFSILPTTLMSEVLENLAALPGEEEEDGEEEESEGPEHSEEGDHSDEGEGAAQSEEE